MSSLWCAEMAYHKEGIFTARSSKELSKHNSYPELQISARKAKGFGWWGCLQKTEENSTELLKRCSWHDIMVGIGQEF